MYVCRVGNGTDLLNTTNSSGKATSPTMCKIPAEDLDYCYLNRYDTLTTQIRPDPPFIVGVFLYLVYSLLNRRKYVYYRARFSTTF